MKGLTRSITPAARGHETVERSSALSDELDERLDATQLEEWATEDAPLQNASTGAGR